MKRTVRKDQAGLVAIVVTMIMMFVITLIVLGFSEVTRRNQREALDSQLGLQAYYAAESGVNDVMASVRQGLTPTNSDCRDFSAKDSNGDTVMLPRKLKADKSVANTCLMVNGNPDSLATDSIAPDKDSVQWKVKAANASPFTSLTFSWSPKTGGDALCSGAGAVQTAFPAEPSWDCDFALLRVDILKATAGAYTMPTDAAALAANTSTIYMKPWTNTFSAPALSSFGTVTPGSPSAYRTTCKPLGNTCSVTVSLSAAASATEYYVRLTSQYRTAHGVSLTGVTAAGPATFEGGQLVVDSTGRAQDQIKRIRVRIPYTDPSSGSQTVYALQSPSTICKDMTIRPFTSVYDVGECDDTWPN